MTDEGGRMAIDDPDAMRRVFGMLPVVAPAAEAAWTRKGPFRPRDQYA